MPKTDTAPFSYEGLDRVIHEKARLGLLTSLMAHPKGLAFADLKRETPHRLDAAVRDAQVGDLDK